MEEDASLRATAVVPSRKKGKKRKGGKQHHRKNRSHKMEANIFANDDDLDEFEPEEDQDNAEALIALSAQVAFAHKFHLAIPFPRPEWAEMACTSLQVDMELKPTIVRRTMEAREGVLHVTYETLDAKMLRTVVSSFFDMLFLVIDTIKTFS